MHFDLNHVSTFHYSHLGADIGAREKARATRELEALIDASLASAKPDSPVYVFLPKLQHPRMSDEQYEELLENVEITQERLSDLIKRGQKSLKASNHEEAIAAFSAALHLKPHDAYLTQQLALATYKSEKPSALSSLIDALHIIRTLDPDNSNDPETLGITGAIFKRLWERAGDTEHLQSATKFYRRGFEVARDYYNGENLAYCFEKLSAIDSNPDEQNFYRVSAQKTRQAVLSLLNSLVQSQDIDERHDRMWIYASLSNLSLLQGDNEASASFQALFLEQSPAQWELDTFLKSKAEIEARRAVDD
jgi:tetratricopeptide (TPR) repeat protein